MNPIEEFYNNSTILITGGNGFLGKTLVEKLLRCFNVKRIYLLIRSKDNETAEMRLQKMLNESIFDLLRERRPLTLEKLTAIEVNYASHVLDVGQKLLNDTQIVFNLIASVKFDEKLRDATDINFISTKKVVNLVMQMENLKSFVHVSTLYTNCNRTEIDEKIYDHTMNYHQLIPIAKIFDKMRNESVEKFLFNNLPNTYTLTKHFTEKFVHHQTFSMPSAIFRPGIIISNYKDFPGHTDNLNGPSGIVAWTVRGFIHTILGDSMKRSNLMPVDYCINALIAVAWDASGNFKERLKKYSTIPIYNHMFEENNLTWGRYMDLVPLGFKEPLEKSIWYYSYFIVKSKALFDILNFTFHTIPACLMDALAYAMGKKMIYRRAFRKTENILMTMSFFGLREWNIKNGNIQRLVERTKDFSFQNGGHLKFDLKSIDWNEYFRHYIPGMKRFYFKENCENVKKLENSYQSMKHVHNLIKYLIYFIGIRKIAQFLKGVLRKMIIKLL